MSIRMIIACSVAAALVASVGVAASQHVTILHDHQAGGNESGPPLQYYAMQTAEDVRADRVQLTPHWSSSMADFRGAYAGATTVPVGSSLRRTRR